METTDMAREATAPEAYNNNETRSFDTNTPQGIENLTRAVTDMKTGDRLVVDGKRMELVDFSNAPGNLAAVLLREIEPEPEKVSEPQPEPQGVNAGNQQAEPNPLDELLTKLAESFEAKLNAPRADRLAAKLKLLTDVVLNAHFCMHNGQKKRAHELLCMTSAFIESDDVVERLLLAPILAEELDELNAQRAEHDKRQQH